MHLDDHSGIVQSTTEVISKAGAAFRWVMSAVLGVTFLAIVVTILAITEQQGSVDFPVIPTAPDWGVFLLVGLFLFVGLLSVISVVVGAITSGADALSLYNDYK